MLSFAFYLSYFAFHFLPFSCLKIAYNLPFVSVAFCNFHKLTWFYKYQYLFRIRFHSYLAQIFLHLFVPCFHSHQQ